MTPSLSATPAESMADGTSQSHLLVPCDGACLDRRAFVTTGMLAAVAAVLATACSHSAPAVSAPAPQTKPASTDAVTIKVADVAELAAAGGIATTKGADGKPIAVVRGSGNSFAAFSLVCPHRGGTLALKDDQWVCPLHGARFGAKDGSKISGPSATNMKALTVQYNEADGTLTISS